MISHLEYTNKEDKAMTKMMYAANRLSNRELEKCAGGSFKSVVRDIGCFMGACDTGNFLLIGEKANADRTEVYKLYRCMNCGRRYCVRWDLTYDEDGLPSGGQTGVSTAKYDSLPYPNLLTI